MHEIITLQLGQRANYLATHYWNTQESYHTYPPDPPSLVNHDISFRPGIGADGAETYMPRTVIYDLKGGFGSLKRVNELYELETEAQGKGGVWSGATSIHTVPRITPSPYISSLQTGTPSTRPTISTVKYWSDFSHTYFHPRSIVQLNDYSLSSTLQPFENYVSGDELFDSLDKEHDLLDRDLRLWAEESDHMQGIQVFTGVDDAWGGFAARYVERIRDEYGKGSLWVWGFDGGQGEGSKKKQSLRTLNAARALHDISAHASVYIPISSETKSLPEYVFLDRSSEWHASALLASAIDSMTLPCRLRSDDRINTTLSNFEASLNVNGNQRIERCQLSILDHKAAKENLKMQEWVGHGDRRMPLVNKKYTLKEEDNVSEQQDLDIDLWAGETDTVPVFIKPHKAAHVFGEVDSIRGTSMDEGMVEDDEDESATRKRRKIDGLPVPQRYYSKIPYEVLETFPDIFEGASTGSVVSIHSRLSTSTTVANRVKSLKLVVSRTVGLDEREALSNGLGEIAEAYEEGWSSGSDDDSDD